MQRSITLSVVIAAAGLLLAGPASASTLYDVNLEPPASPTQAGWTAADATNINNVTFTAVGEGVTIDDRDRADANGGGTESDMWRDFIFANGSFDLGEGMDVTVAGLLTDTRYYVTIWGYDDSSSPTRNATWTGSSGGTSGLLAFDGADPAPATLNDYRLEITAVTDGAGVLTLEGRAGPNPSTSHNVFINGFEISDEPIVVAEPTLTIDRVTGAMTFTNNSNDPIAMLGYSMTSTVGALDPGQWLSIAENYDSDSGDPSVDPDDTWTKLTNPAAHTDLSEFELGGNGPNDGAMIVADQSFDLGRAGTWIRQPQEDVVMTMKLDDGTDQSVVVKFVGNDDRPFLSGDFDFNNSVDDDDYVILRDGLHTDLSALSGAEAYAFGDMNGDSANDYNDTLLFRAAYDAANGPGAFAAMVASVPEPTSLALLGLGGAALLLLRRGHLFHRRLLGLVLLGGLGLVCLSSSVGADSLLFDVNDLGAGSPTQAGWTATDATNVNNVTFTAVGLTAAGVDVIVDDRDRTGNGGGAEAEMWQDFIFANGSNVDGTSGLDVTVSSLLANTTYYVSIWGYDSGSGIPRTTTWTGSNGGTSEVFTFDGSLAPPVDLRDYRVDVSAVTDGSGVLTLEGRAGPNPQNQHNVFINGMEVSDVPLPPTVLTLEVNTDTGATRILNSTGYDTDINYYEITSATGSLDPDGWSSLDAQNFDPSGPGVGESWDEAGGSDAQILAEIYFKSSTNLLDQDVLPLGSAFDQGTGQEDIQFNYGLTNGTLKAGIVSYVVPPCFPLGDVNGDGDVNGLDVDPFVDVLLNGPYECKADMNQDEVVNGLDVDPFVAAIVGGGVQAVPEPSTLALLALAGLAVCFRVGKGDRVMLRSKSRWSLSCVLAVGGLAVLLAGSTAWADSTNDRGYLFGDNTGIQTQNENAVAGQKIGNGANGKTFDTKSETDNSITDLDAQNLTASNTAGPTYVAVGSGDFQRTAADGDPDPPAAGDLGGQFSGSGEYLRGARLGDPSTAAGSIGYSTDPPAVWNPNDYTGIANRGYQLWVYPTSAAAAQTVVMDTNQHGVRISAEGNWSMRYPGGTDVDSTAPVATGEWSHAMVVRPYGPSGTTGGSRLYVDGRAVAAASGGYTGDDNASLVLGSNTGVDAEGNFTGGTEEFFSGVLDNLEMFVLGTSTGATPEDFGTFDLATDNQFVAGAMEGVPEGDVNMNGLLEPVADVNAFVAGWLNVNDVNGIQVGDLASRAAGDLNFDGITDLSDAFVLHEALAAAGGGLDFALLTAAVPEPSTLVLLSLAAVMGLLWRRR